MIVKIANDKSSDLETLNDLLKRKNLYPSTVEKLKKSIRNIRSGMQGEAEAAYEMDFHFKNDPDWIVLHDIRFEFGGRVAQIDHIIINRALEFWVCESKNFSEGIAFNEKGECVAFREGKPYGFASPVEQNKKHVQVVRDIIEAGLVRIPKGKFFKMEPSVKSLILIAKTARISRPIKSFPGLETVIKNESLKTYLDTHLNTPLPGCSKKKMLSHKSLMQIAEDLISLDKPIVFNWGKMFNIPPAEIGIKSVSSPKKIIGSTPSSVTAASSKTKTYSKESSSPVFSKKTVLSGSSIVNAGAEDLAAPSEPAELPMPGWVLPDCAP